MCLVPGCEKVSLNFRGWCNAHYQRWLKHGDPLGGGLAKGEAQRYFSRRPQGGNPAPLVGKSFHEMDACTYSGGRVMDLLEAARLLRFQTDWERQYHEYCLLTDAGIPEGEALRLAALASADRSEAAHIDFVLRVA